jgi:uncharacterized membrane protein YfcA
MVKIIQQELILQLFWIFLLLALVGVIAGTIGSLAGLGGGIIIVPSLLYLGLISSFEVTPQTAVGTSLLVIIITALSSTLAYAKQKKVDYHSALLFFIASGPGAVFGAYVNQFFAFDAFNISFGIFILFISFMLMFRGRMKKKDIKWGVTRTYQDPQSGEESMYGYHRGLGLFISFFVGMLSGLFGIGGGALMVPAMLLLFNFPPQVATATSMFIIFLSAILGSVTHFYYGNIDWLFVLALAPGAWVGGKLGAYISTKLNAKGIVIALRVILIFVGIRLIWQGISGY